MPPLNIDYSAADKYASTREHFASLLAHAAASIDCWALIPAMSDTCLVVKDSEDPSVTHIITHKRYARALVNWAKKHLRKNPSADSYYTAQARAILEQRWLDVIPDRPTADWAIQDAIYGEQKYV